jgi:hypothetical protein
MIVSSFQLVIELRVLLVHMRVGSICVRYFLGHIFCCLDAFIIVDRKCKCGDEQQAAGSPKTGELKFPQVEHNFNL